MIKHKEFWQFMRDREIIRRKRLNGEKRENWTSDPIFMRHRFTNVKRNHDRVTAQLINEFYSLKTQRARGKVLIHESPAALLNAAIFRYHGTIETARAIGWHDDWSDIQKARMVKTNELRNLQGEHIFTSAYIVPSCGCIQPKHEIVATIVDSIWRDANAILHTESWKEACGRLCDHWGVGTFMAKEVLLDYMLITGWQPEDWQTWTPIGPGGRLGAGTVKYGAVTRIGDTEALEVIRALYEMRFEEWPDNFCRLDLTDIQFQLCEFGKYVKLQYGGRLKRRFNPTIDEITTGT